MRVVVRLASFFLSSRGGLSVACGLFTGVFGATAQTVSAPGLPAPIPDPGQITFTLNFPTAGTIASMELFFQFTHQCERDLTMDMVAPDGKVVRVMDHGLMRCSGVATTFTSDNTQVGQSGFFGGHQAQGTWKLIVTDTAAGNSGTLDVWRLTITVQGTAPITIRSAPYDFFVGCNDTKEIAGTGFGGLLSDGSFASAAVSSDPIKGTIQLNVEAAGLVANSFGQAGVGINYFPSADGTIRIRATVRVTGADVVTASALRIARIGIKGGIASVESNAFVSASPPVDAQTENRFRAAIVTPASGGSGLNPFFASEQHTYTPPEVFTVEHLAQTSAGHQLRICAGIDSTTVTTAFPATWAAGKAIYSAEVLKIEIFQ